MAGDLIMCEFATYHGARPPAVGILSNAQGRAVIEPQPDHEGSVAKGLAIAYEPCSQWSYNRHYVTYHLPAIDSFFYGEGQKGPRRKNARPLHIPCLRISLVVRGEGDVNYSPLVVHYS